MQRTLHIRLEEADRNKARLRYYFENPNNYQERSLDMAEIAGLIQNAETDYYTVLPEDFSKTGQKLYHWLDSADRFLDRAIQEARGTAEILVLAIEPRGKLSHLPWEVLHDGTMFFVQRKNPFIAPLRWIPQNTDSYAPENRPLQTLFMATSPTDTRPLLDFEKEEARILEATKKQPMRLIVEESGELEELKNLLDSYPDGWFDVLHLTGHGTFSEKGPVFITENDCGQSLYATAEMIAAGLGRMPRLLFLSGCRTAQSPKAGAMLSLAREMTEYGAKAVLGWGRPVSDRDASMAAAALYESLSCGYELSKALVHTWQKLLENKAGDWHLLRLHIAGNMPGALVTPRKTPGRKKAKPPSFASRFLDSQGEVKVVSRENFIGRRRFLQGCIRSLRYDSEKTGILLWGMGGIGKSSLAARLCDRLHNRHSIVWFGKIDEFSLCNRLGEDLDRPLRDVLMNPDEELKFRLRTVFEKHEKPLLLILDDFETNLDMRAGQPIVSPQAKTVLEALCFAIRKSESEHRIIITCRYRFETQESPFFHEEQITRLDKADVDKKVSRLEKTQNKESEERKKLKEQAVNVADGNPRLLEWLFTVMDEKGLDYEKILSGMAEKETEFRENILAEELLKQQEAELKKMLALASVYEIPVPKEALEAVCKDIEDWEKHIERAGALGLLEISLLPEEEKLYRVSRILMPLLEDDLPEDREEWNRIAAQALHEIWWENSETSSEEQDLEIHRLALTGKEKKIAAKLTAVLSNQWHDRSRFREVVGLCSSTRKAIGYDYRVLHQLARAQKQLGDTEKALKHFQQALADCPDADEKEKSTIIHNVAIIHKNQGRTEEALTLFQQSLDLKESIRDVQGKAATLHEIARIHKNQGRTEKALTLFRQSLELQESIGNVRGKAATLHEIARVHQNQGRTEEALTLFQQSLNLQESIGNLKGKAATLHEIAITHHIQGRTEEALTLFQQSLDFQESIGNVQDKAFTLEWMGLISFQKGNIETALAYWEESIEIFERIGSPEAEKVKGIMDRVIKLSESGFTGLKDERD